jgi:hypothetical protein
MGCRLADDLLIVIADAADRETAVAIIESCAKRRDQKPSGRP